LQGCGGSDDAGADKAAAAASATAAPPTGEITTVDADVRAKVLYAGSTKGFVATALATSMPTGTEGDYDVLVVGARAAGAGKRKGSGAGRRRRRDHDGACGPQYAVCRPRPHQGASILISYREMIF
jgi:hypothetical protein